MTASFGVLWETGIFIMKERSMTAHEMERTWITAANG